MLWKALTAKWVQMALHNRNKPTTFLTFMDKSNTKVWSIFSSIYQSYRTSRDAAATGENIDWPARNASSSEADDDLLNKAIRKNTEKYRKIWWRGTDTAVPLLFAMSLSHSHALPASLQLPSNCIILVFTLFCTYKIQQFKVIYSLIHDTIN